MMKKAMLFLFVAILATSCNAQDSKGDILKDDLPKDSLKIPKGSWKVNKELDEHGNIIRYDSIYSWSSSSGNLRGIENDSLLNQMQSMMQKRFYMFQLPNKSDFTEHDSIIKQFFSDDVFKDDFFSGTNPSNFPNMDDMIKRMEAMRQQFFNDNNRYIIPPEPKKKEKKTISIEKKQV